MPIAWMKRKTQQVVQRQEASAPAAASHAQAELEPQAQSLLKQMSAEILTALEPALAQIEELRQLSPTLTGRMQPLFSSIERIHAIAKSAQSFNENPAQKVAPQLIDAATFFNAVLTNRKDWFSQHQLAVRHSLTSVQLFAKPDDFYTFVDEMLLWCSDFAKEVAFQLEPSPVPDSDIPRARLRMSVLFSEPAHANQPAWQNTRWFVWHRLAKRLGARTELRSEVDRLVLRLTFPAPSPEQLRAVVVPAAPQIKHNVDERLNGLRVLLVSSHENRTVAVLNALLPQGVKCEASATVAKAAPVLQGATLDAVIYDDDLPYDQLMRIRRSPAVQSSTAFLELHPSGMQRDFQPSTSGAFTTGHVSVDAIERSLASALSFELFKTM